MAASTWVIPNEGGILEDLSMTSPVREGGCPLRSVFYAEFDNKAGGKIVHQYPAGVFTAEHSKIFMSHIITNPEYCGKVTVVDSMVFPWTLVTLPCMLTGNKYDRKLFRFNVSFVVAKGRFQTEPYELVLKKLGRVLRNMELRSGYLYGPRRAAEAAAAAAEAEETRRMESSGRGSRSLNLGGSCASSAPSPSSLLAAVSAQEAVRPAPGKRLFGSRQAQRSTVSPGEKALLRDSGVLGRPGRRGSIGGQPRSAEGGLDPSSGDVPGADGGMAPAAPRLAEVLETVYKGLKVEGEVVVELPGGGSTRLSLRPFTPRTPLEKWLKVHDHDVPVRRCPGLAEGVDALNTPGLGVAQAETHFDMALMQVMPHINGVKHIKKISVDTEVDIDLVKEVTLWSLHSKQISLTDVFRYSNVYVGTSRTAEYTSRPDFATSCWERIAKPCPPSSDDSGGVDDDSSGTLEWGGRFPVEAALDVEGAEGGKEHVHMPLQIPPVPHPTCLSRLYLLFDGNRNVREVLREIRGIGLEAIDHRSMCAFGVEVGILRRLHCYPLCVAKTEEPRDHHPHGNHTSSNGNHGNSNGNGKESCHDNRSTSSTLERGHSAAGPSVTRINRKTDRANLGEKFDLEMLQKLCDGTRTEDALCCYLGCSPEDLAHFVTSDGTILYRTLMI